MHKCSSAETLRALVLPVTNQDGVKSVWIGRWPDVSANANKILPCRFICVPGCWFLSFFWGEGETDTFFSLMVETFRSKTTTKKTWPLVTLYKILPVLPIWVEIMNYSKNNTQFLYQWVENYGCFVSDIMHSAYCISLLFQYTIQQCPSLSLPDTLLIFKAIYWPRHEPSLAPALLAPSAVQW